MQETVYFVESRHRKNNRKQEGLFLERRTAEVWMGLLGDEMEHRMTTIKMVDSRHNHTLPGGNYFGMSQKIETRW